MDLLSDVLRELRLRSTVLSILDLRAPWGLTKERVAAIPFHLVLEGQGLLLRGRARPVEVTAGDLVMLPRGEGHALVSEAGASAPSFAGLLEARGLPVWRPGDRATALPTLRLGGTGRSTRVVTGLFSFDDPRENYLLAALPPLLHLPARGAPWLEAARAMIVGEASEEQPGRLALGERVADMIFVQALRAHVRSGAGVPSWLRGLGDPAICRALGLIHAAPGAPLTVASLAAAVGLSRSLFAARFREVVGEPVMGYATSWRMQVAAGRLRATREGVATIAAGVGYASDVAFTRAFRRWAGLSPGAYRRRLSDPSRTG